MTPLLKKRNVKTPLKRRNRDLYKLLEDLNRNVIALKEKLDTYDNISVSKKEPKARPTAEEGECLCERFKREVKTPILTPTLSTSPPCPPLMCQSQSPFMRLPTEIRLKIYENLLQADACIKNPKKPSEREFEQHKRMARIATSIITTCKAVYEEAHPLLYSLNTFCFSSFVWLDLFNRLCGFRRLPEEHHRLALITSLEVPFSTPTSTSRWGTRWSKEETTFNMDRETLCWDFGNLWQSYKTRSLRYLTLDFREWRLTADDEIPNSVLEMFEKAFGNQLHKLTLPGLERQPDFAERLREALLKK